MRSNHHGVVSLCRTSIRHHTRRRRFLARARERVVVHRTYCSQKSTLVDALLAARTRGTYLTRVRHMHASGIAARAPFASSSSSSMSRLATARRPATRVDAASTPNPYPELVVFDLDACFWDEEMYTLSHTVDAARSQRGSLGEGIGEGVVAAASGSTMIRIHKGALLALQNFHLGRYPGMRIAAASSADTPLAVKIGKSALATLEIVPGVRARDVFASGWPDGFEGNMQIGRTPPLSANKAATHFPILRRETGVRYSSMLFFDDCNWGDHCGAVSRECVDDESGLGPVVVRTPKGLGVEEWMRGLELYAERVASRVDVA